MILLLLVQNSSSSLHPCVIDDDDDFRNHHYQNNISKISFRADAEEVEVSQCQMRINDLMLNIN